MKLKTRLWQVPLFALIVISAGANAAPIKSPPLKIDAKGNVKPNTKMMIDVSEMTVESTLPFEQKLDRHATILNKLSNAVRQAEANRDDADRRNNLKDYKAALADRENAAKLLAPYAIAQTQAISFIGQGYKVNDFSGNICKLTGECVAVDSMVAVFYFTGKKDGLGPAFAQSESKDNKTTVKVNGWDPQPFIDVMKDKPLDTLTFGVLPGIRDAIIDPNDMGELAQLIRDPIKRPVEILKEARDKVLGNGDGARILKDPINCTVGKLFGRCN